MFPSSKKFFFPAPKPATRSFTISPAVSDHSGFTHTQWDLDVDGPLNLGTAQTYTIVPDNDFTAAAKIWGAGAGAQYTAGAGGYSTGVVSFIAGTTYSLYVGNTNSSTVGGSPGGGGSSGGSGSGSGGGGYSGIRMTIAGTPIIIAGGGGGGGYGGVGGGGGGSTGGAGYDYVSGTTVGGQGGTQSAGGAHGSAGGTAGSSYTGGLGQGDYAGGGGGGGYYGGGGGGYGGGAGAQGGGGGSSYLHPTYVTGGNSWAATGSPSSSPAVGRNPDNTQNTIDQAIRGTSGNGGGSGVAGRVYLS